MAISLPAINYAAGMVVIENLMSSPVTCHVDGYTKETGWPNDWNISVNFFDVKVCPTGFGKKCPFFIAANYNRPEPVINWVECNGTKIDNLHVLPDSRNATVVYSSEGFQICEKMPKDIGQKCFAN